MRLARVHSSAGPVAVVDGGFGWVPVASVLPELSDPTNTLEALARISELVAALDRRPSGVTALSDGGVRFLAPVHRPGKVIGIGLNYLDHIREIGATSPSVPVVFAKWSTSLHDPVGVLHWRPDATGQLDYEVELAVVVGESCSDVAESEALDKVAGYAVANDVSARDVQFAEQQWVRSKSFDEACPIGPWITSRDKVPNPQDLRLRTLVNGEVRQDSSTSQMLFSVAKLVAFVSQATTLEPGDLILTGTPPGVGAGRGGLWLRHGDVVRCEVEGLGHLEHRVEAVDPPFSGS